MHLTKSMPIIFAVFIIAGIGYVSAIDNVEAIIQQDGYRMAFCTNMAWTFAECNEQYDGYTWTDRFTVLIGANGYNEDPNKIDLIGETDQDPIHVYSQHDRVKRDLKNQIIVFHETGPNTGIFMGIIKMTGQDYDADGDGGDDMMRMTKGNVFCEESGGGGGMAMFLGALPFLNNFFIPIQQFFLPDAFAADYGGASNGGKNLGMDCTWDQMAMGTQEHAKVATSYDYAAKIKTSKQSGAVTVSWQYQEDPKHKNLVGTATHNWRLGEVHFDKDFYFIGEPVTFYIRDADLWTMHHGQPAEYDVVEIWSTSDSAGVRSPVQFVMNHDHGSKNLNPDSTQLDPHAGHKEGALFHAPPTALTQTDSSGQWKVYLWWEPGGVFEVDNDYALNIMFHDAENDVMQENVGYSYEVSWNGKKLSHLSYTNQFTDSGHVVEQLRLSDRGTIDIKIYNINLDDAETTFTFQAAPNSGTLFDVVKHRAYDTVWDDPRWDGYMQQHFVDLLPGRVYTVSLDDQDVNPVKFQREVLGVRDGDQICVQYSDRTQPEVLPNGELGISEQTSVYHVTNCVDILAMPNEMASARDIIFE